MTDVTELMAAKKILDEAKRLLITVGNLTESEAHRWIQKTAMNRRTAKQEIAVGIIEAFNEKI
ncbi:MAG: ANTAR domain-containing protein [Nakamurella sp.]